MNPTSGSDILSYTGNANLGLNTEGLSYAGDTDATLINQAVNRAASLNYQKNLYLYQQKKAEKDEQFNAIAQGKLDIPIVRPEDRSRMIDNANAVKQVLLKYKGDVRSDIGRWEEYQDALGKFNTDKKYAVSHLLNFDRMQAEIASTERPDLKQAYLSHYNQQNEDVKKDFYTDVKPYQHTLDYTGSDIFFNGMATPAPTTSVATGQYDRQGNIDITEDNGGVRQPAAAARKTAGGVGGITPGVGQFYDLATSGTDKNYYRTTAGALNYEKMLDYAEANYRKNDGEGSFYKVNTGINEMLGGSDGQMLEQRANAAIDDLNKVRIGRGLPPVEHLLVQRDQQGNALTDNRGNILAGSSPVELKTKLNLIGLKPILSSSDYDKNAAAAALNKAKINELGVRGAANMLRAKGSAGLNAAKARYWNKKGTEVENSQNVSNIFNDIIARSETLPVTNTSSLARFTGIGAGAKDKTVVLADNLPEGFTKVLGGLNEKGQPIELLPLDLGDGKEGYLVEESGFLTGPGGNRVSDAKLASGYKSFGFKTKQEFIDYLKKPVEEGGKGYSTETELVGRDANGKKRRGTSQSTIQALRSLSNKSKGGKDDDALFQDNDSED